MYMTKYSVSFLYKMAKYYFFENIFVHNIYKGKKLYYLFLLITQNYLLKKMTLHTATVVNPQSSLPVKSEDSYNQVIPGAVPNVFNRQYHTLEAGKYILPCDEEEKGRLNLQHSNFVDLFDG
ncbi:hypothetical protein CLU79DRAFT_112860 [Phycomyces nitens]|nr:hypothetical protein CLU79DRAFT_112860 [Phycomyces nitens]